MSPSVGNAHRGSRVETKSGGWVGGLGKSLFVGIFRVGTAPLEICYVYVFVCFLVPVFFFSPPVRILALTQIGNPGKTGQCTQPKSGTLDLVWI